MIVGGGCSISSGSSDALGLVFFDLDLGAGLCFLDGFVGSGGARRRWIVDSGGLHSR